MELIVEKAYETMNTGLPVLSPRSKYTLPPAHRVKSEQLTPPPSKKSKKDKYHSRHRDRSRDKDRDRERDSRDNSPDQRREDSMRVRVIYFHLYIKTSLSH